MPSSDWQLQPASPPPRWRRIPRFPRHGGPWRKKPWWSSAATLRRPREAAGRIAEALRGIGGPKNNLIDDVQASGALPRLTKQHLILVGDYDSNDLLRQQWGHWAIDRPAYLRDRAAPDGVIRPPFYEGMPREGFFVCGFGTFHSRATGYIESGRNDLYMLPYAMEAPEKSSYRVRINITGFGPAGVARAAEMFLDCGLIGGVVPDAGEQLPERGDALLLAKGRYVFAVPCWAPRNDMFGWTMPSADEYAGFLQLCGQSPEVAWRIKYVLGDTIAHYKDGPHRRTTNNELFVLQMHSAASTAAAVKGIVAAKSDNSDVRLAIQPTTIAGKPAQQAGGFYVMALDRFVLMESLPEPQGAAAFGQGSRRLETTLINLIMKKLVATLVVAIAACTAVAVGRTAELPGPQGADAEIHLFVPATKRVLADGETTYRGDCYKAWFKAMESAGWQVESLNFEDAEVCKRLSAMTALELLARYDVIAILSHHAATTMAMFPALEEFVRQGGGLVVVQTSQYETWFQQPINEMLPITVFRQGDGWHTELAARSYHLARVGSHPITEGIDWSECPPLAMLAPTWTPDSEMLRGCLMMVAPRETIVKGLINTRWQEILRADDLEHRSAAVVGQYGRGRVFVFGGWLGMAEYRDGMTDFVHWSGSARLWRNALRLVVGAGQGDQRGPPDLGSRRAGRPPRTPPHRVVRLGGVRPPLRQRARRRARGSDYSGRPKEPASPSRRRHSRRAAQNRAAARGRPRHVDRGRQASARVGPRPTCGKTGKMVASGRRVGGSEEPDVPHTAHFHTMDRPNRAAVLRDLHVLSPRR